MSRLLVIAVLLAACTAPRDDENGALPAAPDTATSDSAIFAATMQRARAQRLDTLPIGDVMVTVGRWFVGAPYTPYTIEINAPREALVVNLREFDCVTFVENTLV